MQSTTLWQRLLTTILSLFFFALSWLCGNLSAIAAPTPTTPTPTQPAAQSVQVAAPAPAEPSAEAIFKAAYEKRYAWDKDFPGFTADVAVKYGNDYIQGSITLQSDLGFKTEKIIAQDISNLIASQVQMVTGQFDWQPFDVVHQGNTFKQLPADQPSVRLIEEKNENVTTVYRLEGDRVIQLNRNINDVALQLKATNFQKTPQGEIPSRFTITITEIATGKLIEQDEVRDTYEKIGNYYLLSKREVRTALEHPEKKRLPDYSFRFTNLQLQHPAS
jgi:hypothetical protein